MNNNYINSVIKFANDNLNDISNVNEKNILMKLLSFAVNKGKIHTFVTCNKNTLADIIGNKNITNQGKIQKVSKIAQKLKDKGYLESAGRTHIKYNEKTLTTTKWVFGRKSIEILEKMVNQKAPPKGVIKKQTIPSFEIEPTTKAVKIENDNKNSELSLTERRKIIYKEIFKNEGN